MPKQNRPLIRDGRIQTRKRTDRSYLRPAGDAASDQPTGEPDAVAEAIASAAPAQKVVPPRLPTSVRAIQQQGVRKRGDLDLHALAVSDSKYALHELRRIVVLAAMVVATLIVLAMVLR